MLMYWHATEDLIDVNLVARIRFGKSASSCPRQRETSCKHHCFSHIFIVFCPFFYLCKEWLLSAFDIHGAFLNTYPRLFKCHNSENQNVVESKISARGRALDRTSNSLVNWKELCRRQESVTSLGMRKLNRPLSSRGACKSKPTCTCTRRWWLLTITMLPAIHSEFYRWPAKANFCIERILLFLRLVVVLFYRLLPQANLHTLAYLNSGYAL